MVMASCVGLGQSPPAPDQCRCTRNQIYHHHQETTTTAAVYYAKPKMKMLKKIKKKIGIGRSSCTGGTTGATSVSAGPPLTFHAAHGDNIRLSRDLTAARRVESFCKGIAFSARPVTLGERVCVRITNMSDNWSGVLRFGYTSHDPSTLAGVLPKYACPDLTNKAGHWAKALAERLCERGTLLQYYVTPSGDVHYSIDGEDKGVFFTGVDTKGPLWAILDIYGNCNGVQFVDSRAQLNNNIARPVEHPLVQPVPIQPVAQNPENEEIEQNIIPALRNTTIADTWRPVTFHRTCGSSIILGPEPGVAHRDPTEYCQGYVFTSNPLAPGERLLIRILATDASYYGSLALGLTSCDPARLNPRDLPNDSDGLLDRPEYWVVSKDVAGTLKAGEELLLSITTTGEVKISLNGAPPSTVMHVDHSLRLWAFLDVYGSTMKVQLLSRPPPAMLVVALPPPHSANHLVAAQSHGCIPPTSTPSISSGASSTTSLPVTLTTPVVQQVPQQRMMIHRPSLQHAINGANHIPRVSSTGIIQTSSVSCVNPQPSVSTVMLPQPSTSVFGECTICYEQQIDSVLYVCGHMCMCYRCAVQQWKGKGGGQCPICRAPIRDVIKTFKS